MRVATIVICLMILATCAIAKEAYVYPEFTGTMDRQGGEDMASAAVIGVLPFSGAGTTIGYLNDYDEVCPYTGSTSPDVVYSVTPCMDGVLDITLCGASDYDTKLYVYDAAGMLVACNDDFCPGYVSELMSANGEGVAVTGGALYYIIVDGYSTAFGNYTIDITGMDCTTPTKEVNFSSMKALY
jgi:hypothetical protein